MAATAGRVGEFRGGKKQKKASRRAAEKLREKQKERLFSRFSLLFLCGSA
jgi:hypothetical protein